MTRSRGYSLIEALIVVTVLLILTLIAIPNYQEARIRSMVAASRTDLRTICQAYQSYDADHSALPPYRNLGMHFVEPHFLTTPVPYLTQVPEDLFFQAQIVDTRHGPIALTYPVAAQYAYYALSSHYQGLLKDNIRYVLAGRGPDHQLEFGYLIVEYDPSNGVRSRGDIIMGGPGSKLDIFSSK